MKKIPFVKVAGSGNDFILIDARGRRLGQPLSALAKRWCSRKGGIGADGLLVVSASRRADARMRIFNPDGSEAALCGNGLRCVAWTLFARKPSKRTLVIETAAGLLRAERTARERVRIFLPPPRRLRLGLAVAHNGTRYQLHAVHAGVPHAILFSQKPDRIDLNRLGPVIRHHRLFQPAGTNLDLVRIDAPHRLHIRTYERGVEAETEACGTGAVASVVIGAALGRLKSPVQVIPKSREQLTVGFDLNPRPWKTLHLEGPAQILFEGEISK